MLHKTFLSEIVKGAQPRSVRVTVSTRDVDREGDVLEPSGWVLDSYRRNPTVLWAHDYKQPPVAKATEIRVTDRGLVATAQFPPEGTHDFADTIYNLVQGGYVNATSVGFRPMDFEPIPGKGRRYTKQELLEFSFVPIPCNDQALVEGRMLKGLASVDSLGDRLTEQITSDLVAHLCRVFADEEDGTVDVPVATINRLCHEAFAEFVAEEVQACMFRKMGKVVERDCVDVIW